MIVGDRIFIVGLFLLFTSCSSGQTEKQSNSQAVDQLNYGDAIEESVVGTWKNSSIEVDLSTYNNTDTSFHVSVNESSWKVMMNMNPIYTQIKEDGTFFTEYRDTLDNVFHTNKGIWYIDGDSLFLKDEKSYLFPYKIIVKDHEMEMQTMVDYDEDGKKDDFYFGKYKRVKK